VALLTKDPKRGWVLGGRESSKHKGETLEKVAEADPSYLTFMWQNSLKYLSDEAINALDDVMEKKNISRELKRRKR